LLLYLPLWPVYIGAAAAPTTTAAPPATTTAAAAAGAAAAGENKAAVPGENCMPPAMYFMELMTCNSRIDEETERLFPALFATFEEEERQKLEDKLNKLKAVRSVLVCTDKKVNKSFLIYKEILVGSFAKSYMRKGFLKIYEEMHKYFHHI
jgi:hypothetical protein